MQGFDLGSTFLALDGKGGVVKLPIDADFWRTIDSNPAARGTMVGVYPMTSDWPNWEMHPKGDEVLVMLEGRLEMTFERAGAVQVVLLEAGSTLVVPAGVWHTAKVLEPGRLLGMTYGEGTEHRPA